VPDRNVACRPRPLDDLESKHRAVISVNSVDLSIADDIRTWGFSALTTTAVGELLGFDGAWAALAASCEAMSSAGKTGHSLAPSAAFNLGLDESRVQEGSDEANLISLPVLADRLFTALVHMGERIFREATGPGPERPWRVNAYKTASCGGTKPPLVCGSGAGVDYVLAIWLGHANLKESLGTISTHAGRPLGEYVLRQPGDALLLDRRIVRSDQLATDPVHLGAIPRRGLLVLTYSSAFDDPTR
jgi:hypothetical protein